MGRTTAVKNFMVKPSVLTEARILTDSDSGKTYFLNAATGFTVTLPKPRGGVNFEFIVKTAPTSANYVIYNESAILVGQVYSSDVNARNIRPDFTTTASPTKEVNIRANIATIGDSVKVYSDGTYWYVSGFCSKVDAIQFLEQSKSPSVSPSVSVSRSPSVSVSISPSVSSSISVSRSPSVSVSISPSVSTSISPSISPSAS